MAMICMAVYDTAENKRTEYTARALQSLLNCNLIGHRIFIIDNNSCQESKAVINDFLRQCVYKLIDAEVITNQENVGTAKAINQAWRFRKPNENLIKMDNDIVINGSPLWVRDLEDAINRDKSIGIIGLKRKDCIESPLRTDFYKSEIHMLPHENGQRWFFVEKVNHVIGSCCMFNSALVDKIGGLYQMDGIYGFDDSLAAIRCQLAGFYNCFLPHIDIDHIDRGDTEYQKEKERYALSMMDQYNHTKIQMQQGKQSIIFPL